MPKVVRVIKKYFCFVAVMISSSVHSQNILNGVYEYSDLTREYWVKMEFTQNNIFSYESGENMRISEYGKGHYTLTKDSLFFYYNLTELMKSTYHKISFYNSFKDSIEIKFRIITADNQVAKGLNVGSLEDRTGIILENSNYGSIKLKKEKKYKNIFFSSVEYNKYDVPIYGMLNYDIEVYLQDPSPYSNAIPIKFATTKYKILKNKHNHYIELQDSKGSILTLKKVAKGYYANDPFEE